MNERLTDDELDGMINDVSHWGDEYSARLVMALRELQLLRAQCDDQAALITRLEHRLFAKGLDNDTQS